METRILRGASPGSLKLAVRILFEGGLVAFPTDTVYGLGAMATNQQAIDQLYVVKGRDTSKAIAVLVGDPMAVAQVAGEMNELARNLSRIFWPGPLTLVIPANPGLPVNLSSTQSIGVRMPDHPIALQLLRLSGPLAVSFCEPFRNAGLPHCATGLRPARRSHPPHIGWRGHARRGTIHRG